MFPIRTEPLFAVLRRDHPRASAKSLALKDLRGESFVMLRDGHCFRDLSIATCTHARITPHIAFESGQFSSLLGMVAAGVGVSLIPEMAIDRNVGCRYVRLSDAQATRTIVAAVVRGRSFNRVQRAFLSELKSAATEARAGKNACRESLDGRKIGSAVVLSNCRNLCARVRPRAMASKPRPSHNSCLHPQSQRTMVYGLCCSILPVMLLAPL